MDEQVVKLELLDKILSKNLTWVATADSKGFLRPLPYSLLQ
mgnify:CR=1 FL=1